MLKTLAIATLVSAAAFAVAPHARACDGEDHAQTAAAAPAKPVTNKGEVATLTVPELAAKLEAAKQTKTTVAIFDANSAETRAAKGIIPTAVLLPSSSGYDVALLPKEKSADVVFYCAAEKCGASKTAAKKAMSAGYTNVHVLPAGIAGWVKAGLATEKVAEAQAETKPLQG